jgi:hypothetical protein
MKSIKHGKRISKAYISNISPHCIWVLVNNIEYFLPYSLYPWFKEASASKIFRLEFKHGYHLHWPELDIDLELDSIKHPSLYPSVYR